MNGQNPLDGGAGPLCKVTLAPSRAGCVFVRSDFPGFHCPLANFLDQKTYWWDFANGDPFAQVIGGIPPNRSGERLCKLTFPPSLAAAVFVSSDFRDPAQNPRCFSERKSVLHVWWKNLLPIWGRFCGNLGARGPLPNGNGTYIHILVPLPVAMGPPDSA